MKIKKHYFYTFLNRKTSRTYGGEDYTLAVFENKGRGKFVKLGEVSRCTRGHKGYDSEAWGVVWNSKSLGKIKNLINSDSDAEPYGWKNGGYYSYRMQEKFGIKLEQM